MFQWIIRTRRFISLSASLRLSTQSRHLRKAVCVCVCLLNTAFSCLGPPCCHWVCDRCKPNVRRKSTCSYMWHIDGPFGKTRNTQPALLKEHEIKSQLFDRIMSKRSWIQATGRSCMVFIHPSGLVSVSDAAVQFVSCCVWTCSLAPGSLKRPEIDSSRVCTNGV